jgi:hypothetical protein
MSMVSVHGSAWMEPFFTENDHIAVNLLGEGRVEFKYKGRDEVQGLSYSWDFGDGTTMVDGYEVTHTYGEPARRTIKVQVTTYDGVLNESIEVYFGGAELFEGPGRAVEHESAA